MGIGDRMIFPTPAASEMHVVKQRAEGTCPRCGSAELARYPVGHYKGPRMVTKCQACYHSLAVEMPEAADNWPPFRAFTYDWEASPAERVGRLDARRA
jgi:transcription elongation factor Elf1